MRVVARAPARVSRGEEGIPLERGSPAGADAQGAHARCGRDRSVGAGRTRARAGVPRPSRTAGGLPLQRSIPLHGSPSQVVRSTRDRGGHGFADPGQPERPVGLPGWPVHQPLVSRSGRVLPALQGVHHLALPRDADLRVTAPAGGPESDRSSRGRGEAGAVRPRATGFRTPWSHRSLRRRPVPRGPARPHSSGQGDVASRGGRHRASPLRAGGAPERRGAGPPRRSRRVSRDSGPVRGDRRGHSGREEDASGT